MLPTLLPDRIIIHGVHCPRLQIWPPLLLLLMLLLLLLALVLLSPGISRPGAGAVRYHGNAGCALLTV